MDLQLSFLPPCRELQSKVSEDFPAALFACSPLKLWGALIAERWHLGADWMGNARGRKKEQLFQVHV